MIYCGAGVTYDLTNLGWDDLIKEVFEESFKEEDEEKQTIMNLLNSTSLDAKQKASIVMTYLEKKEKQTNNDGASKNEKIIITEKLQEILYKKRGWGRGNLLSNIVMLAMLLVKIGREVEIVTTNYDVYLLLEFKDFIRHQQEQPGRSIAGVKLKNFKNEELFTYMKETNGGGYVTVTFLHGRVDKRVDEIVYKVECKVVSCIGYWEVLGENLVHPFVFSLFCLGIELEEVSK